MVLRVKPELKSTRLPTNSLYTQPQLVSAFGDQSWCYAEEMWLALFVISPMCNLFVGYSPTG